VAVGGYLEGGVNDTAKTVVRARLEYAQMLLMNMRREYKEVTKQYEQNVERYAESFAVLEREVADLEEALAE
jgi:hypothetical protein